MDNEKISKGAEKVGNGGEMVVFMRDIGKTTDFKGKEDLY